MNENDFMTPPFEFLLLCNGVQIGKATYALTTQGAYNVFNLTPLGNGRYTSSATNIGLRFQDTQYMGNGRLFTKVMCDIDAMPVGLWTPLVLDVSDDWPQGVPIGVLHWLKDNRVWSLEGSATNEYERFSLIVVKA